MGQDAFFERYEKPRNRLQIVVFVSILAVSIFLATQVEKAKDKAAIRAKSTLLKRAPILKT
ncbi:MAG: hypothetical protein P8Y28_03880 [Gammaproteobacteria bacterium]